MDSIELVTEGRSSALKICEKLLEKKAYKTLDRLIQLNITGKKLEVLFDLSDLEDPLQYLIETVDFLSAGYIDKFTMSENLKSNNPVKFIYRLLKENEDKNALYQKYTNQFYSQIREKNNKRK